MLISESSTLQDTIIHAGKRKLEETDQAAPAKVRKADSTTTDLDLTQPTPQQLIAQECAQTLATNLRIERRNMDSYEQYLQKVLQDGENASPSGLSVSCDLFPNLIGRRLSMPLTVSVHEQSTTPGRDITNMDDSDSNISSSSANLSLSEGVNDLNVSLQSEKTANKLYEMRLQALLNELPSSL